MKHDFSKITLLSDELRLLRHGKRKHGVQQSPQNQEIIQGLYEPYKFIELGQDHRWHTTRDGVRFLCFRWEDRFQHRWPVYLSILSLVVSVVALVRSFF